MDYSFVLAYASGYDALALPVKTSPSTDRKQNGENTDRIRETVTVTGKVLDSEGRPIEGAKITLRNPVSLLHSRQLDCERLVKAVCEVGLSDGCSENHQLRIIQKVFEFANCVCIDSRVTRQLFGKSQDGLFLRIELIAAGVVIHRCDLGFG